MSKIAWIVVLSGLFAATTAVAQTGIPNLRGTWKGESETMILGAGNLHHAAPARAMIHQHALAAGDRLEPVGDGSRGGNRLLRLVLR